VTLHAHIAWQLGALSGAAVVEVGTTVAQAVSSDPGAVLPYVDAGSTAVIAVMVVLLVRGLLSGELIHARRVEDLVEAAASRAAEKMAAEVREVVRDERR